MISREDFDAVFNEEDAQATNKYVPHSAGVPKKADVTP